MTPEGRAEVWAVPHAVVLGEWQARRPLEQETVLQIVQAVAGGLLTLHERGLAFLRLSPESVMIDRDAPDAAVLIGVEQAIVLSDGQPVPIEVDLCRAPPEALGREALPADASLMAWDWWTLGRLAQELLLGRPMVLDLVGRDLPRDSAEVRRVGEALLNETHSPGGRAGAVELMPDLSSELLLFLRGTLTTVYDARWGATEVRLWLEGKRPPERYELARHAVVIQLWGEALTLPEVAQRYGTAEHWTEGLEQFGAEEPAAGSPAAVLLQPGQGFVAEREWYAKVRELRDATALRQVRNDARIEVLSALAWLGVAPNGTRLRWKGRTIDAEVMSELVREPSGLERAKALCLRAVVELIQPRDNATAWALRMWSHEWEGALSLAERHRWVTDGASRCRLASHVFRPGERRTQALAAGRQRFHSSSLPPLQEFFGADSLTPVQLVLAGYALEQPERFGFITHEQWLLTEQARLQGRAEQVATAIRCWWVARAVRAGAPLFGASRSWWLGALALLAFTGLVWPGVGGLAAGVTLVVLLATLRRGFAPVVQRLSPTEEGQRWRWAGVAGCLRAATARVMEGGKPPSLDALLREFSEANRQLTRLLITPKPAAVPAGSSLKSLWLLGLASWMALILFVGVVGWRAFAATWNVAAVRERWEQDVARVRGIWEESKAAATTASVPEVERGKPVWPFVTSGVSHPVAILERLEPTSRHLVLMKSFLLAAAETYAPGTVLGLVAVAVPLADGQASGLMVLDVGAGQVVAPHVYRLEQMPVRGMTIDLDGRLAVYVDAL